MQIDSSVPLAYAKSMLSSQRIADEATLRREIETSVGERNAWAAPVK